MRSVRRNPPRAARVGSRALLSSDGSSFAASSTTLPKLPRSENEVGEVNGHNMRLAQADSDGAFDPRVAICVAQIIAGCGVNVIFLELITKRDPSAGGLITLAQFTFVSLLGLKDVLEVRWFGNGSSEGWGILPVRARVHYIPLWFHASITVLFFLVNFMNNTALGYGISLPLHMLFRSSSLSASMLIGWLAFNKTYQLSQIQGVLMVTCGILFTTVADARYKIEVSASAKMCCGESQGNSNCAENFGPDDNGSASAAASAADLAVPVKNEVFAMWLVGLGMLVVALFLSAGLGHFQEYAYRRYGRASSEMKFYSHFLALPYFVVLQRKALFARIHEWNASPTLGLVLADNGLNVGSASFLDVPFLWLLLLGNVLSQLICISAVYRLTAISSSLTTTMTTTFRKFLSIIVSIVYFNNPFSKMHLVGTTLTFAGVGIYFELANFFKQTSADDANKKKEM